MFSFLGNNTSLARGKKQDNFLGLISIKTEAKH